LVVALRRPDLRHALDPALVGDPGMDRRLDVAGTDGIHTDSGFGELQRDRSRHRNHRRLARAVDMRSVAAGETRDAGDVDDRAAAARLHRARGLAHAEEHAALDDAAGVLVFLERDRGDRPEHAGDRGVVDEAIEPPPALKRCRHGLTKVALDAYVELKEHDLRAELPCQRFALPGLHVAEQHAIAGGRERFDAGCADAACAAGDQADRVAAHAWLPRAWLICACATDARTIGMSSAASGFIQ